MSQDDETRDSWYAEGDAAAAGISERDYDVAYAAELPVELSHHALAAAADADFVAERNAWFEYLHAGNDLTLMVAIEQCCHEGALLPWDMRGVRLKALPHAVLAQLHRFLDSCPRHVLVHLAHHVYWLIRSERARRRGSPEWSTSLPLPPLPAWDQDEPSFRPMRRWPARWP